MTKVAAIDIGTNSVRLLVCDLIEGVLVDKHKQLAMTRIGKDVDATGMLNEDRMEETIQALSGFKSQLQTLGIETCPVFATSAVRDAANRHDFVTRVKSETSFEIDVITGDQEAQLGFLGVVKGAGLNRLGLTQAPMLVIDIGGGSTELIVGYPDGVIIKAMSLDIGAVRLTDRHGLGHGLAIEDFDVVRTDVHQALAQFKDAVGTLSFSGAFGIGGTATTLGAIDLSLAPYDANAVNHHRLSTQKVREIAATLCGMSYQDKLALKGLMPKRADIIAAGAVILAQILTELELETLLISDDDNLEGALYQMHLTI